jgi:hypothetical protein
MVLGLFEHPGSLVVDDEECHGAYCVTTCNRTVDEVDHDVASSCLVLIATIVGQFDQHWPGDPAACEGQGGFILEA